MPHRYTVAMQQCDLLKTMRPVTIKDRALFERYLAKYPPEISELTFTNPEFLQRKYKLKVRTVD